MEGRAAREPTVGALADPKAPTCRPGDRLADLRPRMVGRSWCAVLTRDGVVLGRVRRRQLEDGVPDARARDVMEPGPSTYRPSLPAAELLRSMQEGDFGSAFVTTSDGRWVGLVTREDLEAALRRGRFEKKSA